MNKAMPDDSGREPNQGWATAPPYLLDAHVDPAFQNIIALARRAVGAPIALISILDTDRQYFKAHEGLPESVAEARETPLSHSFCQHVVSSARPLVVNDARTHELVCDNLAISDLGVMAYLGYPLTNGEGAAFGAFCVIDTRTREWTRKEMEIVEALAAQVMSEISLRLAAERKERQLDFLRREEAERTASHLSDQHDLRTPLNALLLCMQTMEILGDLNEEQTESLRMAERNAEALLGMLDGMLEQGRGRFQDAGRPGSLTVAPAELMERAADQVTALANERGQSLSLHISGPRKVEVDYDRMLRVLVNLLANAIKFTPPGGGIAVSVRDFTREHGAPAVLFTVSDNGMGVEAGLGERIFEEGFRGDDSAGIRESSGLGLAFCRRTIEAHGGRIWLEDREGGGSHFHFYLPAAAESPRGPA